MKNQTARQKIAEILRSRRVDKSLSVRGLARKAGISTSAVYNLENGKDNLGPVTFQKLAAVLPFTPEDREQLALAASATSTRMKTSPGFANTSNDYDHLCKCLLRAFGDRWAVNAEDFFQGYGPKSGVTRKEYDLLIRLRDTSWMGFEFKSGGVSVAKTDTDEPGDLQKPGTKEFEERGGITYHLVAKSK